MSFMTGMAVDDGSTSSDDSSGKLSGLATTNYLLASRNKDIQSDTLNAIRTDLYDQYINNYQQYEDQLLDSLTNNNTVRDRLSKAGMDAYKATQRSYSSMNRGLNRYGYALNNRQQTAMNRSQDLSSALSQVEADKGVRSSVQQERDSASRGLAQTGRDILGRTLGLQTSLASQENARNNANDAAKAQEKQQMAATAATVAAMAMMASSKDYKQGIKKPKRSGLEIIKDSDVKTYQYKKEFDPSGEQRLGLIAEQAPDELTSSDKKAVDVYSMTSAVADATKELSERIEKLEKKQR